MKQNSINIIKIVASRDMYKRTIPNADSMKSWRIVIASTENIIVIRSWTANIEYTFLINPSLTFVTEESISENVLPLLYYAFSPLGKGTYLLLGC